MWPPQPRTLPPDVTEGDSANSAGTSAPALESLLERWRLLTLEEGDAIRRGDWRAVRDSQASKRALQPLMDQIRSHRIPAAPSRLDAILRLEQGNLELLATVRQMAEREREALERSRLNLTRLQRSYVAPSTFVWESSA
jgi:hypothetical protein